MSEEKENYSAENIEAGFHLAMLESTLKEVEKLRMINKELTMQQLRLRDMVAMSVYSSFLDTSFNAESAAEDSYRAADAFMRIRDRGRTYDDDMLEIVKNLTIQNPNDSDLGSVIREFLNKKISYK